METKEETGIAVQETAAITPIKESDHENDGTLKKEAHDRAIDELYLFVKNTGVFRVNTVAKALDVHWYTARNLMGEVAKRILSETEDIQAYEIQYYFDIIEEVRKDWDKYGIMSKRDEEELISSYFEKIHKILKLKENGVDGANPANIFNLAQFFENGGEKVKEYTKKKYGLSDDPGSTAYQPPKPDIIISNDSLSTVTTSKVADGLEVTPTDGTGSTG